MKRNFWFILAFFSLIIIVSLGWILDFSLSSTSYQITANDSSCLDCHGKMSGLSPLHEKLECVSCHKGSNRLAEKDSAHFGMIKVPGNLVDAPATCGVCHPEAMNNIKVSLMTTNSGIIAIDKYIFGEFDSPNTLTDVKDIHHSPADEHLRSLCLRCHLGSEKEDYTPIDELSRGGGCNACHLNYSATANTQLADYLADGELPTVHPSLDLNITDNHCFGCHSRSGRISTNYQGFHETLLKKEELQEQEGYKVLMDDRVFTFVQEDIHHARGLACIDCHGFEDVMGDGISYLHEEDAVKISCQDCHAIDYSNTKKLAELSLTQQRIHKIRGFRESEKGILITQKDSVAIINSYVDNNGAAHLISKLENTDFNLLPPSASCTREYGHQDLTCSSCHTGWAPQCIGCHVSYEPDAKGYDLLEKKPMDGSWVEYAGAFLSGPPTLGVRTSEAGKDIEPAIPGMIMTMDKNSFSPHALPGGDSFYRLFAPAAPHTTTAEGRTCTSCHNNPLALGYGRGELVFDVATKAWEFTPEYETLPADGLPADAWTGFLQEPAEKTSTRLNFRPFTIEEQQKILTVGTCFTCHDNNSAVMKASLLSNFDSYLKSVSEDCLLPMYD